MHAVIFELDNCLAASDDEANWVHGFDKVAGQHGFSNEMRDEGWRAFGEIEVRAPMRGYGDLDRSAPRARSGRPAKPPVARLTSSTMRAPVPEPDFPRYLPSTTPTPTPD